MSSRRPDPRRFFAAVASTNTWVQWLYEWTDATPGQHLVAVHDGHVHVQQNQIGRGYIAVNAFPAQVLETFDAVVNMVKVHTQMTRIKRSTG